MISYKDPYFVRNYDADGGYEPRKDFRISTTFLASILRTSTEREPVTATPESMELDSWPSE